MKNRLFIEGLATTIIGAIILGVSIYMWVAGKATQIEVGAMVTVSLIFFRAKSSLIGIGPKDK